MVELKSLPNPAPLLPRPSGQETRKTACPARRAGRRYPNSGWELGTRPSEPRRSQPASRHRSSGPPRSRAGPPEHGRVTWQGSGRSRGAASHEKCEGEARKQKERRSAAATSFHGSILRPPRVPHRSPNSINASLLALSLSVSLCFCCAIA